MKYYTLEQIKKNNRNSIYLAGPSFRPEQENEENVSWRIEALDYLHKKGYTEDIYIPEYNPNIERSKEWTYSRQVSWEIEAMEYAKVILFWIPRDMKKLPGLTTNIEFGEWMHSNKLIVGFPEDSDKNKYIEYRCSLLKIPFSNSLESCVNLAINKLIVHDKSKIFFTSDTHFNNKRILELSKRPFMSTDEMDWVIIKNWNTIISDQDSVYHLRDFGNPEMAKYLKGHISFIPGNYDTLEIVNCLKENGVRILLDSYNKGYRVKIDEHNFTLVHAPADYILDRNFMLFGHIHKLQMVKQNGLNVSVDCHNFFPIDIDTVLFYKNAILNHYDKNVFC